MVWKSRWRLVRRRRDFGASFDVGELFDEAHRVGVFSARLTACGVLWSSD